MGLDLDVRAHARQRWAARGALAAAGLAVLLPIGFARAASVLLLVVGVLGTAVTVAALWWVLTLRGPARAAAGVLALATPATVIGLFAAANLLWVVVLSLALWGFAVWAGKFALSLTKSHAVRVSEHRTPAPARPFLIMNPRSGGGKVEQFGLKEKAERLGARVHLLDPEHKEDVTELARRAVADGADLLGVAGGDGTQALVAAIAAEHDIPFLVVSAGTRNHFAMDLGLDRNDPAACLDALTGSGVEVRVDLGFADGHPFVNNASFGAYAVVVQSPEYRDDKVRTTLELLPELLTHQRGPRLSARIEETGGTGGTAGTSETSGTGATNGAEAPGVAVIDAPQALLVSNNPYRMDDPAGLGYRERLESGLLGVLGIKVENAAEAAGLLLGVHSTGLTVLTAREVVVDADRPEIEAGVDGEAFVLPTPVRCRIEPGALRVRVPWNRPGVPETKPPMDWRRLRKLAAAVGRTALPKHRALPRDEPLPENRTPPTA
ncbi:PilC/PilY family type IV pilus protein [Streptomyces sp. ActVer]|uniref:diacylglycerol/lipid kinase family protein n=1 Tax=Streptomyces sp. ActVer TaxID=3014558 RepID=UPI0022B59404|nr:diacylglycerol kinase family protein [Streptomyces sp. ActVer]MCZ4511410.1 PilC/PilY family type IV pilus protein [Streptomyces sp. ActVer]